MKKRIVVSRDGKGDFDEISQALESADRTGIEEIHIMDGIYKEKLLILNNDIKITGQSRKGTVVEFDDFAHKRLTDKKTYGTFRSETVKVMGEGVSIKRLTIKNSADQGSVVGQAVALMVLGDRFTMEECDLLAYQDTLMTGPLPEELEEVERDPSLKYRGYMRQLYKNCRIAGNVDFIFGGGHAVFYSCDIQCLEVPQGKNGYISAPSTPKDQRRGHVFIECRITGVGESFFLGRPWREYGKCMYIECVMDGGIKKEGWSCWRDTSRHKTCEFTEINSSGSGAIRKGIPEWVKVSDTKLNQKKILQELELLGRWAALRL